jgi:DivIVA domain-containing protein
MTVVFVAIGLLVAAGIVLVAVGIFPTPVPPLPDRAIAELPFDKLAKADLDDVRFGVGLRGYRMDEVDGLLDRVASELAEHAARVAELEAQLAAAPRSQGARPEAPRTDGAPVEPA